jgi:murein DD-endopeptidase MepM/ murein hydrolase activator NlpD
VGFVRDAMTALWSNPVIGKITSAFGVDRGDHVHAGVDIGASLGSPIYAAEAGEVIFAGPMSGYGHLIKIQGADGIITAYGHMYSTNLVKVGQQVAAGTRIASVGSDGQSSGPHLHLEVIQTGKKIDPIAFFKARGITLGSETPATPSSTGATTAGGESSSGSGGGGFSLPAGLMSTLIKLPVIALGGFLVYAGLTSSVKGGA